MKGYLLLDSKTTVTADKKMNNATVRKLWSSFHLTMGDICFEAGENNTFRLGDTPLPALPEGKEYVLKVDENGAAIVGNDYGGLMRGFMSLLLKIDHEDTVFKIKAVTEESNYKIKNRMIHICVFPENDLYFIKKLIRLAAVCQYTHVIIEFWGMLQFDCLKELAWPHAFTKDQMREVIQECWDLGIQPVPMSNQLGHATASRVGRGKHVVLDQNPRLQRLFTPDGWAWNIKSAEVFSLLKQIRLELNDLFGDSEYFHIGCDEAYYITRNEKLRKELPDYLARLTREVEAEGKRPMLWMDMLLEKSIFKDCYCVGEKDEVESIRNSTAKSTVFVDWQYNCCDTPIPSLHSLKDCGRDVMGAPWYNERNYRACIQTVRDDALFGIMLTTWHTLNLYLQRSILGCARDCGAVSFYWSEYSGVREETATLMRRISFEGNSYTDSGWSKQQIEV